MSDALHSIVGFSATSERFSNTGVVPQNPRTGKHADHPQSATCLIRFKIKGDVCHEWRSLNGLMGASGRLKSRVLASIQGLKSVPFVPALKCRTIAKLGAGWQRMIVVRLSTTSKA